METQSKLVLSQIRYLDLLRENGLLEEVINGRLPDHVVKAAKQAVLLSDEFKGCHLNDDKTAILASAEEHDEAQIQLYEYLRHYKITEDMKKAVRRGTPRVFRKGAKYHVRRGYFEGRIVTYKGTDQEMFGCEWLENQGNPICERYIFRAQRDGLNVTSPAFVFHLDGENRDIILQDREIGMEYLR